jgi:hypothetical protein
MAVVSRDNSLSNGFDSRPLLLQGWEAKNFVRYRWWNPSKEVSFGSGSSQGAQTTVRDPHDGRQDQHDQCACRSCPREHSRLMKSTMAFVCTVAGVGARIALRRTCGRGVSKVWCSPAQFCIIPLCRQPVKDDQGELEKRKGIGTGWERCTKERTEGSDDVKSK